MEVCYNVPEALDFIINYDIKYRMGKESGDKKWTQILNLILVRTLKGI